MTIPRYGQIWQKNGERRVTIEVRSVLAVPVEHDPVHGDTADLANALTASELVAGGWELVREARKETA